MRRAVKYDIAFDRLLNSDLSEHCGDDGTLYGIDEETWKKEVEGRPTFGVRDWGLEIQTTERTGWMFPTMLTDEVDE